MVSNKREIIRPLKFSAMVVLSTAAFCLAAERTPTSPVSSKPKTEQSEREKAKTLREVARNWIQVGISQSERGLYQQAEQSFIIARGLQEYLTAEEHKKLEEYLSKTREAIVERKAVIEHIKKAKDLVNQGQPIEARAHYEKVRNSPYLTEQERIKIANELKNVDESFDKRKKEITDLYNRSVEFYRVGQLEKAREGFVEVARYGLLVAPEGQTAEDYLIQIDSILTERLKSKLPSEPNATQPHIRVRSVPPSTLPVTIPTGLKKKGKPLVGPPAFEDKELELLQQIEDSNRQAKDSQEEIAEVTSAAEPLPEKEKSAVTIPAAEARAKIIRTYTKAVVEDAEVRTQFYVSRGEFDKAVIVVRNASEVVRENRSFIGDGLFTQYTIQLKRLADRIVKAQKSS